ncbi:hypothetical protein [Lysinibacillus piscis]|uniref:DUF4911 domain-containing protein n=1 Tax=Lysinibacillus piscis TaxID=2518931 RepID=A0ABQ5NLZ0_9BACI|nr:hypothetical protein [Lysinibacillus sp. KH24]GLC89364.1 hypothetical protein LYSBPC_24910 [Lysinibacillus sp. KH24]
MPIKVIPFADRFYPESGKEDCIILRYTEGNYNHIEIAFPFHEDTQNFRLSISDAMSLKNAIDELINIKFLENPRGN